MRTPEHSASSGRLTLAVIMGSLLLLAALLFVYSVYRSQLALAQAADSLSDFIGAAALGWGVRSGVRPPDAEHPHGHARAEPIAALIVAVLAGVLSAEVLRSAVTALVSGARPNLDWPLATVFAVKVAFKSAAALRARSILRQGHNPVMAALLVDSRNDVLVGCTALIGFALARAGLFLIDPLLAIATAIYIAYAGLQLGRENVSLLLGENAAASRRQELAALAARVPGVLEVRDVVALWHGTRLRVQLTVRTDGQLSLNEAHVFGHRVEQHLCGEPDVAHVMVHVEPL